MILNPLRPWSGRPECAGIVPWRLRRSERVGLGGGRGLGLTGVRGGGAAGAVGLGDGRFAYVREAAISSASISMTVRRMPSLSSKVRCQAAGDAYLAVLGLTSPVS